MNKKCYIVGAGDNSGTNFSKEKDEYVNQAMERMTSMEPYYCNPFDNPKELKERASDLPKRRKINCQNAEK